MRFDLILFLFCFAGYVWTICCSYEIFLRNPRINKRVFAVVLFGTGILLNTLNERLGTPYILNATVSYVISTGLVIAVFRDSWQKKLFVAAIVILTKTLVLNLSDSFFSCLALIAVNKITKGEAQTLNLQIENIVGCAAYCMVILVMRMLEKKIGEVLHGKTDRWYLILSAPLLFIVFIIAVVNWGASNGVTVVSDASGPEYWNIYYNQFFGHAGICLLTTLSACISAALVFGTNKIYAEQKQKEQYRSQIEFYKMLNEQYLQMERLRHDMKNHVLSLHGLYKNEEYEKIGTYLKKMLESGDIGANDQATGNTAVDALLYNKRKNAEQNNISWKCDVRIPGDCGVDEFDLCVLFGNILDNALHACYEVHDPAQPFICVESRKVKNCFLLVVKNGTGLNDIKEIKQGIGLLNIRETVNKYDGVVSAKVEDHVFEISVLIPLEGAAERRHI